MPDHSDSVPIKFRLEAQRSLVADAALENRVLCSIGHNHYDQPDCQMPVVDQQIVHLVQADGIICIPIRQDNTLFCVLVVGCTKALQKESPQAQLLEYFADEISLACEDTLKHIRASENNVSNEELNRRAQEIAHEANNPLNIINNYLLSLGQKLAEQPAGVDSGIQEELNIVREEVERTSQILMRLKDLKHDTIETQPGVNINDEIQNLATLYKSSIFLLKSLQCQLNLDPEMSRSAIGRNQFKQILTNLLKNAAEAMANGGSITISSTANVNVNGKDFAEILIEDSGPGIPESVLKDLFTPITSTKGNGHSGLGLSITKNLVKDAKGTISCRSNDNGTIFQILLPNKA